MATAISALRVVENNYDVALEMASPDEVLRAALAGNRAALAYATGRPQLILEFVATVSTGTDVAVADLTALYGVLAPAARSVREFRLECYSGGATTTGMVETKHGVKNVGGTISAEHAAINVFDGDGSGGGGLQIVVSTANLVLSTFGTTDWGDDVYLCQAHVFTKLAGPILSLV